MSVKVPLWVSDAHFLQRFTPEDDIHSDWLKKPHLTVLEKRNLSSDGTEGT